jgi:hypothetical protein
MRALQPRCGHETLCPQQMSTSSLCSLQVSTQSLCPLQVSTQFAGRSTYVSAQSEATKRLQLLEALLRVPASLGAASATLLAGFLQELFATLTGKHGEHALARAAVGCLTSFLLHVAPDAYTLVPQVTPLSHC